jgi:DHA1 family chloramphenicol resistance protein-like MFS transporter
VIAGATLTTSLGERGPVWAGSVLVAVVLLLALPFRRALGYGGRTAPHP